MSKPHEGAWHGRNANHFVTRGAEVRHDGTGWYAIVNRKVRGPLSSLDAAFAAADRMLADAGKVTA